MIYQLADIVRDVKVAMDENGNDDALVLEGDVDTLSLDAIIKSKILEAARLVLASAPAVLLDNAKPMYNGIHWLSDESGRIYLPDDYYRIVVFQMDDWKVPVLNVITAEDVRYAQQHSPVKGLHGNPARPVVALVPTHTGMAMEFFGSKSRGAKIKQSLYLPEPAFDRDGGLDVAERCYNGIVYLAAALTCTSIGRADMSQVLVQLSKEAVI